jgi:hypothetical protein
MRADTGTCFRNERRARLVPARHSSWPLVGRRVLRRAGARLPQIGRRGASRAGGQNSRIVGQRAGPLLDRVDRLRLSVLAACGPVDGRALVLVVTARSSSTALLLGSSHQPVVTRWGVPAHDGRQRQLDRARACARCASAGRPSASAPAVLPRTVAATFDFGWFGLTLLCCLSLVAVAACSATIGRQRAWGHAQRSGSPPAEWNWGCDRHARVPSCRSSATPCAARSGMQDGLQQVGEGYVAMALQVVDGLERQRLVPAGRRTHCRLPAALPNACSCCRPIAGRSNSPPPRRLQPSLGADFDPAEDRALTRSSRCRCSTIRNAPSSSTVCPAAPGGASADSRALRRQRHARHGLRGERIPLASRARDRVRVRPPDHLHRMPRSAGAKRSNGRRRRAQCSIHGSSTCSWSRSRGPPA